MLRHSCWPVSQCWTWWLARSGVNNTKKHHRNVEDHRSLNDRSVSRCLLVSTYEDWFSITEQQRNNPSARDSWNTVRCYHRKSMHAILSIHHSLPEFIQVGLLSCRNAFCKKEVYISKLTYPCFTLTSLYIHSQLGVCVCFVGDSQHVVHSITNLPFFSVWHNYLKVVETQMLTSQQGFHEWFVSIHVF
jgi:hypothetical protein